MLRVTIKSIKLLFKVMSALYYKALLFFSAKLVKKQFLISSKKQQKKLSADSHEFFLSLGCEL